MELLANEINRLNKLLMDYIHENENLNYAPRSGPEPPQNTRTSKNNGRRDTSPGSPWGKEAA